MSNSLQQHGIREINKQLRFQMKKNGLDTVAILVTRRAGKIQINFTGSPEQVVSAEKILAAWA
jgi:Mg2+/Co2+ transporter CorB